MTIQIGYSAPPFAGQKGRKLLVPVPITLGGASGFATGVVRVSLISTSSPVGVLWIQAMPGTWNSVSTGAMASVESPPFPTSGSLPHFTAFPSFLDNQNLTTPTTGYSATYLIEVFDTSVPPVQQGSIQFTLTGDAAPAQSVNVVFALDHGSTMATTDSSNTSRLARLKAALPLGVALLRDDDTLGVVSFGNLRCSVNPQLAIGNATSAQQGRAITLGNDLVLDTSTPAVKCIQMGIDAGRALSPTAMLVLVTDGVNTNAPGHVLTQPTLPTSALIIGEDPNQIPASAAKMVSADGHYAFASKQTLGEFAIEKLLTQVLIGLSGSTFINDPDGSLGKGETQSFPLQVTEADRELEAIVFSNDAGALSVKLELHVRHQPHSEPREYVARQHCHDEHQGIEKRGVLVTRLAVPALADPELVLTPQVVITRTDASARTSAPVRFNLLVVAKTDLMLDARVVASGPSVGSDLLFSATLKEYGRAWARPGVSVQVELSHPDGFVQTIKLEESAPGRFEASLRSFRTGTYTAHFIATGKSLLYSRPFRRECVRTIAVYPASDCCSTELPCASTYTRT